ncbi:hypothetical protein GCM10009696_36860 [Kocuria himachalensis]
MSGTPSDAPDEAPLQVTAARRGWVPLARNRFWLIVPILVLDLALTGRLPRPLAPGSPGPDIPGWVSWSETGLRVVVLGAPLLMPLSLHDPRSRPVLAVYILGLTSYAGAWAAVVWAPTSAWSTSAVGFTALAWTSIIVFLGIGLRSTLHFVPRYRPWMYLGTAICFTGVHTLSLGLIWAWYY